MLSISFQQHIQGGIMEDKKGTGKLPENKISLEQSLRNVFGSVPESYETLSDDTSAGHDSEFVVCADLDVPGINIGYEPGSRTATLYIYARTDENIPIAIENLQQMELNRKHFEDRGYDTSRARLNHELKTADCKEYEIDIPIKDQEDLDFLVTTVKELEQP
jgi:hypothetical protein